MSINDARFSVFHNFVDSSIGREFRGWALAHLRKCLAAFAPTIDPNWHSVEVDFPGQRKDRMAFLERSSDDKDARRLEFSYQPEATLIGPKVGHVLIGEDKIFDIVPEPLIALLCLQGVFGHHSIEVLNPKHVVEVLEGRTVVYFENCVSGVVLNVQGDTFDVEGFVLEGNGTLDEDQSHYTRKKLLSELKLNAPWGQATAISYLPFLPVDGVPMDTIDAVREARRRKAEKWQAEHEAQAASQRAAEEARR